MSTETKSPLTVHISPDRLFASITIAAGVEPGTISPDDVMDVLKAAGVAPAEQTQPRIEEYVNALRSPDGPPKGEFEIATGRPAKENADGTFTREDSVDAQPTDADEDAAVDYYSISAITTVERETVIGRIAKPEPGADGVDVQGKPLRLKTRPREVILKNGVKLGADGVSVIATAAGRIVFQNLELSIDEVVTISGDVDFETGNLDLTTNAIINGSVRDLFKVSTQKDLTVGGAIEAAEVRAEGDVVVRGGILHRNRGKISAGGTIVAKFCNEAEIHAQGDIRIAKSLMSSKVHTEGKVLVPHGSVIAGELFARRGVEAGTLGSDAGAPTSITVGLHPDELRMIEQTAQENEKRRAAVEKIRQAVRPLADQLKRLTGAQREKAIELTYQADALEAEIKKSEQAVAALHEGTSEGDAPYVLVNSRIHQRVSIAIGDREVSFHEAVDGPIKIERRKIHNHTVVASVNQLTGSLHELPARKIELKPNGS